MTDKKGNKELQPEGCDTELFSSNPCKNLQFKQGWDDETYECLVCGAYFKLYYDEMQ